MIAYNSWDGLWKGSVYFTGQKVMQGRVTMEFNFEGLEMWKWNIPTDRAEVVDEKSGVMG